MSLSNDYPKNLPFPQRGASELRHHPLDSPEPVSPEADPELRRLDVMLAVALRSDPADLPPGLADRIFRASVGYLPTATSTEVEALPAAVAGRIGRPPMRARVALAASIAAAFVLVGIRLALDRDEPSSRDRLEGAVAIDMNGGFGCLMGDDAEAAEDRLVRPFLDTVGTSLADLESELLAITGGNDVGM